MSKPAGTGGANLVKTIGAAGKPPGMIWMPTQAEAATGVLNRNPRLTAKARDELINSASKILGSGVDPKGGDSRRTGLVVGYVQSGKTLSFTTVMGLARDNGFPIVILFAGNKTSLLDQSHDRLKVDLDVDGGTGLPAWIMLKNPKRGDAQSEQYLERAITNFRDTTLDPDEKQSVLIAVLKQNQRLGSLTTLLKKFDLRGVPVLVVDDEADQASLNIKVRQGAESTTYSRILELRSALPRHTYLQYTATPQALLLINIADTLSPDFTRVLEPGEGYVGGSVFFAPRSRYARTIPIADVAMLAAGQPDPPESFIDAVRLYFVGLAVSLIRGTGRRSMLIHPAREKAVHQESADWATALQTEWKRVLALPSSDPDRTDLLADFKVAYDDLARTERKMPEFDDVVQKLPRALRNTQVIEFNTRGQPKTPDVQWRNSEGWILIGGQAVDRGFTVDSLTVTYMPRGTGMGNADTLQQRARFFGYKNAYLGLCRVFLEADLRTAFENYLEHEAFMRKELSRQSETGESLANWRRRFILDPALEPCRASVVRDGTVRRTMNADWTTQRGALLDAPSLALNSALTEDLAKSHRFDLDTTFPAAGAAQEHYVARNVPLKEVLDFFLAYKCTDALDTANTTGLSLMLRIGVESDPTALCSVYRMRPKVTSERTIEIDGSVPTLQQGPTRKSDGSYSYQGDRAYRDDKLFTLQLYSVRLLKKGGGVEAEAAPMFAAHIPTALRKAWLVQVQAGQVGAT